MSFASWFHKSLAWFFVLALCVSAAAQDSARRPSGLRIIVASHVVCRAQPNRSAKPVVTYELGDVVLVSDNSQDDGEIWYFSSTVKSNYSGPSSDSSHPPCWIHGSLTAEVDESILPGPGPGPLALAAADNVLRRSKEAQFEDYVAAEDLLLEPIQEDLLVGNKPSGLLQFRRLSVVRAAIRVGTSDQELYRSPLKKAWLLLHSDLVFDFGPDDLWYIRPEPYWTLYDQYSQEPWAEELAWTAARLEMPSDECYAGCVLSKVERTYLQYWKRRPNGSAIQQDLKEATADVQYAATEACPKDDSGNPDYSVPRSILDEFRKSLLAVTAPEKQQLLSLIDQIQRQCYPAGR